MKEKNCKINNAIKDGKCRRECSACHADVTVITTVCTYKYCPYCGRKVVEKD